jgi:uncharacterized protein (TIGR03545 family)
MSWVKKGPVLGTLGAILLLWAFVFFFFDPILKHALISGGQAAAGAKVEIGSVRSKWLKGTLELRAIAVADKEAPMKNAVELSRAAFQLDVSAALRGKGVVREAALEGLRVGTERKTSGALRAEPPSALGAAISKQIAPVKSAAIKVESNATGEVDSAKLQGLKKYDDAKAKSAEIEKRWKGKDAEAKAIEKEARDIGDQLKAIGGNDVLKKAQAAGQAQQRIKALIARVDAQKAEAQKDIAEAQALVKEADELRKKDLNGLLSAAGLPTLDSQDLAKRLLGAQTASRLTTALRWMRVARERAAARAAAAPPAPASRRAGVNIEFPRAHSYPQYLLENAKITGTLDGVMGGALDLKGVLDGVTSNPKLYGKPATLTLGGKSASGPSASLNGRLDQQKDPVGISLDFTGQGFSLAGTSLGDGEVGGSLTAGQAKLRGHLASTGDEWTGEVFVEASGVKLEPKVSLAGPAGALVSDALKSLTGFNVRVGISGREDALKLAFSSNAGEAIAAAMRKAVSGQIEAQKKILETKLAAAYGGKEKEARASVDGLAGKLLGPLDAQKGALDKQLKDAVGKALGGQGLNRLFKH